MQKVNVITLILSKKWTIQVIPRIILKPMKLQFQALFLNLENCIKMQAFSRILYEPCIQSMEAVWAIEKAVSFSLRAYSHLKHFVKTPGHIIIEASSNPLLYANSELISLKTADMRCMFMSADSKIKQQLKQ